MGTWGSGNLENDYALEELADRSDDLIGSLFERAKRKTSREFDEYDHTTLFVEFEIAFALNAKGLLNGELPRPEEVEELKKVFVKDWDDYYQEGSGATQEHIEERKGVIIGTFNKFKEICKKYHDEQSS